MTKERIDALRKAFSKNYEGVLITNLTNVRYLCGYTGSNGVLLVTRKKAVFFTDFRYQEQCEKELNGCAEIVIVQNKPPKEKVGKGKNKKTENKMPTQNEVIFNVVNDLKVKNLGIEKSLELSLYLDFVKHFKGEKLIPTEGLVEKLRQYKDEDEISSLQTAFDIADASLAMLIEDMKVGMTEIEVAALLEFYMKTNGSEQPSFDTIVASGPNASCPHHQPTNRQIQVGDMVKIDFGATFNGYHSDMTRTFFIGKATKEFKKIYGIVAKAQKDAIKAIKLGEECKKIDDIARKVIEDAGYGENFGHGLGHSFGCEIHESPSFNQRCKEKIEGNQTFTVEPGIYLPKWGGIRIEDSFLVREDGKVHKFTNFPNKLMELDLPVMEREPEE